MKLLIDNSHMAQTIESQNIPLHAYKKIIFITSNFFSDVHF